MFEEMEPYCVPPFVPQSFDALQAEQAVAQRGKFQGRMLHSYSNDIFPGQSWKSESAVADFMRPYALGDTVSLETVLDGLSERAGRQIHWVDMQGGRGLAQRHYTHDPDRRARVATTMVDLFDYGMKGLKDDELDIVQKFANGAKPELIIADVQEVVLDRPADVITCEEGISYLDDPLRAIANWYNQLAGDGFLFISGERYWSQLIGYDLSATPYDLRDGQSPVADMLDELTAAGIPFAATKNSDEVMRVRELLNPADIRSLIIQKVPGTQMMVNTVPTFVNESYYDHKNPLYHVVAPDNPMPPVQVVRTPV